jgi:UDP-N-acetylglucosamine pyrophosphorylase
MGKLLERRCLKWACMTHLETETQVMAKRKAGGQIGNLIPNHKKLRITSISLHTCGVRHTVGKFSTRDTALL